MSARALACLQWNVFQGKARQPIVNGYLAKIEHSIGDVDFIVAVRDYTSVEPWKCDPRSCPSDLDYYGHTEMEWDYLDIEGNPAPWLEDLVSASDVAVIEQAINDAMDDGDNE